MVENDGKTMAKAREVHKLVNMDQTDALPISPLASQPEIAAYNDGFHAGLKQLEHEQFNLLFSERLTIAIAQGLAAQGYNLNAPQFFAKKVFELTAEIVKQKVEAEEKPKA